MDRVQSEWSTPAAAVWWTNVDATVDSSEKDGSERWDEYSDLPPSSWNDSLSIKNMCDGDSSGGGDEVVAFALVDTSPRPVKPRRVQKPMLPNWLIAGID